MHDPAAEPGLEPVHAVEGMVRVVTGGDRAHVVGAAVTGQGVAHGLPVQGVGGHEFPAVVGRGAVEEERPLFGQHQDRPGQGIALVPSQQQYHLRVGGQAPVGLEQGGKIAVVACGKAVALGGLHVHPVEEGQLFLRGDFHPHPLAFGQADVVAGLGLHAAEQVRLVAVQVNHERVGHGHVHRRLAQVPALGAEIHAHFPDPRLGEIDPVLLAHLRRVGGFPRQVVADEGEVRVDLLDHRFGQGLEEGAVLLLRRGELRSLGDVGGHPVRAEGLDDHQHVAGRWGTIEFKSVGPPAKA